jgi:hypothetical protein
MFEFLCEVNRRPEPFSRYTARELWTDPHTSRKMLALHGGTGHNFGSVVVRM